MSAGSPGSVTRFLLTDVLSSPPQSGCSVAGSARTGRLWTARTWGTMHRDGSSSSHGSRLGRDRGRARSEIVFLEHYLPDIPICTDYYSHSYEEWSIWSVDWVGGGLPCVWCSRAGKQEFNDPRSEMFCFGTARLAKRFSALSTRRRCRTTARRDDDSRRRRSSS